MSLAARSPRSRKSLSAFDQNIQHDIKPLAPALSKGKKRAAASIGGEGLKELGLMVNKMYDMTAKRNPRHHLQPRKSILKPRGEDDTMEFTQQYAHTLAFGSLPDENSDPSRGARHSLGGRRVSFAPNAHVRMFGGPTAKNPRASVGLNFTEATNPPSKSNHSRRSSIQNIGSVSKPNIFAHGVYTGEGEGEGEESMEIEDEEGFEQHPDQQAGYEDQGEESMDMEEDDMDITTQVYGGIIRRSSMAPSANNSEELDADADTEDEADSTDHSQLDEEQTMDFTVAIGGFLPTQAPEGALSNRNSIGYSFHDPNGGFAPNLIPGEAIEGEEYVMEETETYGQIIGQDVSFSSGSEDTMTSRDGGGEKTMTFTYSFPHEASAPAEDDGMDMVTSVGGIITSPEKTASNVFAAPRQSTSATPSFARPTVASTRRSSTGKRNIFGPSPSPAKSPAKSTTPRKSAAADVAKRLSFEPTSASGSGKKRAREDQEDTEIAKRSRVDVVADEVFGTPNVFDEEAREQKRLFPTTTPKVDPGQQVLSARRSSLGTAMRLSFSHEAPVAQAEKVGEVEDFPVEEEPQAISLGAFLEMTGVQFMEGLPGMNRRKSSAARGVLGQPYGGDREFALHEYTEAQVNHAANKLRDDINTGNEELLAVEARCEDDSPPVIQEYLSASEEDRQLFEMTFKSFKTNTHLKAREMWYDWKRQLLETIEPEVAGALQGMQEDAIRLEAINGELKYLLPLMRKRKQELEEELVREREAVKEIAQCDQAELAGYREGIAEQSAQITVFSTELNDAQTKLSALASKLDELLTKKHECEAAIAHAKSQCDQFTRSEAVRLQEEYTSLQHLHLWRPLKTLPNHLSLSYDNEISVSFSCHNYIPDISSAELEYLEKDSQEKGKKGVASGKGWKGESPTSCLFEITKAAMKDLFKQKNITISSFIQSTGHLWSQSQRLRAELRYMTFHHPLTISYNRSSTQMQVGAGVMVRGKKSKVVVEFGIGKGDVGGYPGSLGAMDVGVKTIYGSADASVLEQVAKQTIKLSSPEACLGTLLQVCAEVASKYSS
ncbi:hypothetical protein L198_05744 [Cryptococcus wingfieldii CBS 7118]|uniref:Spc7 kinetochore protein domain-containing protein n=1 Tax=Cryptococcus wingfieldii CBS 7118 TaxID=1295528 RepID=A0A1E3IU28_9TREE|nr:hypothetical protein L198_05744 [Cryptococcus wingfieldii CBS 7118]ODN92072.1 hypothetical protein L198_05744 [Cryptococcus wingfieldii CBS 7118]